MFETYRILGRDHEADLEREARKRALAREAATKRSRLSLVVAVVALAVTVAMLAATSQAASGRTLEGSLARGAGVATPDLLERAIARRQLATSPDLVERAVARLGARDADAARTASSPAAGFDWSAAGIGASTASLLFVLAAVGFGAARHVRMRSLRGS
jgi:hypothetical protein